MQLNALASDFALTVEPTVRASVVPFVSGPVYLTDPAGNRLTDPLGNYLIAYYDDSVTPVKLTALTTDFSLNAG